jgi:hypothetical protein
VEEAAGVALVPASLAARTLEDQRPDAVLLLLRGTQLLEVGLASARGLRLRRTAPGDQGRDLRSGGYRSLLEALLAGQVVARSLTLHGDRSLRRLDLGLLRHHPGAGLLQRRQQRGLLVHQGVHGVHLAGDLGRVLRVEHHREADQCRVTVGVVAGRQHADLGALVDDLLTRRVEGDAGQGQAALGVRKALLHQRVETHCCHHVGLGGRQPALGG